MPRIQFLKLFQDKRGVWDPCDTSRREVSQKGGVSPSALMVGSSRYPACLNVHMKMRGVWNPYNTSQGKCYKQGESHLRHLDKESSPKYPTYINTEMWDVWDTCDTFKKSVTEGGVPPSAPIYLNIIFR